MRVLKFRCQNCGPRHGPLSCWFGDGNQKSDAAYELGICITKRDWDTTGALTYDYRLAESDPQFKILQRLRELFGGRSGEIFPVDVA